jgi:hypothetical protein
MQNSIVFCAEKSHSLKNDKTPIKKQRGKVEQNVKHEKKNQHPNPSNAGNLAPHIIQAANRLAAPAPLFSEYVLANIKNTNNLVRLRIEDVRVSNSFNEKRASIERSIIRSKLPMHKRQAANQKTKARAEFIHNAPPFNAKFREGKTTGTFRRRVTTAATHPQFLSAAPPR